MTDDQMHALQDQRLREALAVEIAALREHAERARWCEERRAAVGWSYIEKQWVVTWFVDDDGFVLRDTDRDAAIDRARGK
jgi:hypothetical protein